VNSSSRRLRYDRHTDPARHGDVLGHRGTRARSMRRSLGRGSRSTTLDEIQAQKARMSSAGILLSEFKRTNSANRTLSRVLMPRRPDSGGSMRLAERCTDRARATTSHKPRRHSNQSTLPTRRRSPGVPCVPHMLAAWTFAHRTTQRTLEHGVQEPGHRSTPWHPACCGSRRATLATRSGLATPILPSDGGLRPPNTSQR
jgi:hypothetical protein